MGGTTTLTIDKDGEEAVKERLQSLVSGGDDLVEDNDHQVCMGACGGCRVRYRKLTKIIRLDNNLKLTPVCQVKLG